MVDAHPTAGAEVPSGRQIEIGHAEQRATIVEFGGGIRSYSVAESDIIDGYAVNEMCSGGRGQVLMPWPNRIADGAYTFDGEHLQLPLSEPDAQNAIHGLVRWVSWEVAEQAADRVVMTHRLRPQPGYPFTLDLRIEYRLSEAGLDVRNSARNVGAVRCPFGAGAHPYLRLGDLRVDDIVLRVPARAMLRSNERGIPIGRVPVAGSAHDFRAARAIGPLRLDDAYTDLDHDADGRARVCLTAAAGDAGVALWVDEAWPYLMVFSGDTLPDGGRRSLAVEPMSCAPNAFVSGDGLRVLEPGASFDGAWGIEPVRGPG
jgi:aldose 1-epimerase